MQIINRTSEALSKERRIVTRSTQHGKRRKRELLAGSFLAVDQQCDLSVQNPDRDLAPRPFRKRRSSGECFGRSAVREDKICYAVCIRGCEAKIRRIIADVQEFLLPSAALPERSKADLQITAAKQRLVQSSFPSKFSTPFAEVRSAAHSAPFCNIFVAV